MTDYTKLHKLVNGTKIPLNTLEIQEYKDREAAHAKKITDFTNTEYMRKRKEECGTAEEQLDYIAKNGIDAFRAFRQSIEQKHPAPEKS